MKAILVFALLMTSPTLSATDWQSVPASHRDAMNQVLPPVTDASWDATETAEFVRQRGTRGASFLIVGLLMRNHGTDTANAQSIVRLLLTLQHNAPGEPNHGLWMTSVDPERDRADQNWREFVASGLMVAQTHFSSELGVEIVKGIDRALLLAAQGAQLRNVDSDYTNIALMSALLMDYVGITQKQDGLAESGMAKATRIHTRFSQHGTFAEFNSPTYYGVNLMALAMWRSIAKSQVLRGWGTEIESILWKDIGAFYHVGLRNFCGPYARAYGMDAASYTAITGLCIGMALDDMGLAPLPTDPSTWQKHEIAYSPILSLLGIQIPDDARAHLQNFQGDRTLARKISYREHTFEATATLRENWMMGGSSGMRRRWDQHHPGTLHWKANPAGDLGWLLVIGDNAAEAEVDSVTMTVRTVMPDPEHPIRLQLSVPDLSIEQFSEETWTLPGLTLHVTSPLGTPSIEWREHRRRGRVIEVSWEMPEKWTADDPVLRIEVMEAEKPLEK